VEAIDTLIGTSQHISDELKPISGQARWGLEGGSSQNKCSEVALLEWPLPQIDLLFCGGKGN
jgi:hypothetical protein